MPISDILFQDAFTDAANTRLDAHTPDVGSGWCMLANNHNLATSWLQVDAGGTGLVASVGLASGFYLYGTRGFMPSPDVRVRATVTTVASSGGGDDPFWLIARACCPNNLYGAGSYENGTQKIYKTVAGVSTQIATLAGAIANGDYFEFYLLGSRLELHKNGSLVLSGSDSSLAVPGRAGFGMGAVFVSTDDSSTTWVFDDYSAKALRHLVRADSFTDPNDTDLRNHIPDKGSMWATEYNDTPFWEIVSNSARASASWAGAKIVGILHPELDGTEYAVGCSLPVVTALTGYPVCLIARFANALNYYSGGTYRGADANDKAIYKCVAGVYTLIAQADSGLSAGDTIRLEVEPGAQRLYHNDALVVSGADTALNSPGSAGIGGGQAMTGAGSGTTTSWSLDDFKVWLMGGPLSRDRGGVAKNVVETSAASYNVTSRDYCIVCDTTSGDVTVNLPPAGQENGRILEVVNKIAAANNAVIDPDGSEQIEGAATYSFPGLGAAIVKSDGTQWWVVAVYYPGL